jgi:phosphoribosylpyrophosphate synthetase
VKLNLPKSFRKFIKQLPRNQLMIIVGCSHGKTIGRQIAQKAKKKYSELFVEKFPDNELHIKFQLKNIKGEHIVLVQSFYGELDSCLMKSCLQLSSTRAWRKKSDSCRALFSISKTR